MRLLRGLAGRVLACGCLVGIYETYNKDVIATIDARGSACTSPAHRLHERVDLASVAPSPRDNDADRQPRDDAR